MAKHPVALQNPLVTMATRGRSLQFGGLHFSDFWHQWPAHYFGRPCQEKYKLQNANSLHEQKETAIKEAMPISNQPTPRKKNQTNPSLNQSSMLFTGSPASIRIMFNWKPRCNWSFSIFNSFGYIWESTHKNRKAKSKAQKKWWISGVLSFWGFSWQAPHPTGPNRLSISRPR